MKTEDRGETWRMQTTGTSAPIRSVHFLDRNTGWAVGTQGVALFTKDGGETWELTEAPPLDPELAAGKKTIEDPEDDFVERANLLAVRFDDPSNGWAVSSLSVVYRSTDGGATWLPASDKSGEWIAGVHLMEGGAGLGVSSFGTLRSTADLGATWEAQTAGTSQFLVAADFLDKRRGWVVGRKGTVLKTEDAGENWAVLDSGSEAFLLSVDFIDENNGWAVGRGGAILRTADGGPDVEPPAQRRLGLPAGRPLRGRDDGVGPGLQGDDTGDAERGRHLGADLVRQRRHRPGGRALRRHAGRLDGRPGGRHIPYPGRERAPCSGR